MICVPIYRSIPTPYGIKIEDLFHWIFYTSSQKSVQKKESTLLHRHISSRAWETNEPVMDTPEAPCDIWTISDVTHNFWHNTEILQPRIWLGNIWHYIWLYNNLKHFSTSGIALVQIGSPFQLILPFVRQYRKPPFQGFYVTPFWERGNA